MSYSTGVICGFLDGTIVSVEGGYRVLQHPRSNNVFNRIADARWFLAISWCDQFHTPAGILTHDGKLTFQNQAAIALGETIFLPSKYRSSIFTACLSSNADQANIRLTQPNGCQIEVTGIDIDPRYGKVAMVRTIKPSFQSEAGY